MMTLELGRIKTWRLPVLSALTIETRASFNTLARTMLTTLVKKEKEKEKEKEKDKFKLKRISRSFRNGKVDISDHESRKSTFFREDESSSPVPAHTKSGTTIGGTRIQASQDRFSTEDTGENIIYDEEDEEGKGGIKAATVEKLVQRVTPEGRPDPKLLEDFLLTYRSFITPVRLMELLKERFHTKPPAGLNSVEKNDFNKKVLRPVHLRILNLCKSWIRNYNADFTDDPQLAKNFENWMDSLFSKGYHDQSKSLIKELKQICKEAKVPEEEKKSKKTARERPIPKPHIPPEVRGARTLLDFHAEEVARQLALIEMKQFRQIKPWELLGQSWTKEGGGAVHVREMIAWSTRISQLISTEVIKVPIEKKTKLISHCIQIGGECVKLNNYNAVMEILAGFSNSAVNRLQPFFKEVPKKEQKLLKELRAALSSDKNFRAMRDKIKTAEPPILPYLGTFLTDLTFIEDGNPDRVRNDLVNFKKCRLQSQVIRDIQQYQQLGYRLEVVPEIQKFLQTGMIMDNKTLYKVSIKHLPREAKDVGSVNELLKKKKTESKSGGGGIQYCRGTMTIEDAISAVEHDDEITLVSLCRQKVGAEDMEKLANLLSQKPNVHTLRLCHEAYADRHDVGSWDWMKQLIHIRTLDLSNQDLTQITKSIVLAENVTHLFLQYNQLEILPETLGYLSNLEDLKCEGNKLKEIPETMRDCKKLRSFNVSANKLICLPDFLPNIPELRYFYCSDNNIKEPVVPPELLQKGGQDLLGYLKQESKPVGLGLQNPS